MTSNIFKGFLLGFKFECCFFRMIIKLVLVGLLIIPYTFSFAVVFLVMKVNNLLNTIVNYLMFGGIMLLGVPGIFRIMLTPLGIVLILPALIIHIIILGLRIIFPIVGLIYGIIFTLITIPNETTDDIMDTLIMSNQRKQYQSY